MDPNQVPPVSPTPTEPVTPQPPVAPVVPPVQTPFVAQPPQSVASTEVFGSSPQPVSSVVAAYPSQNKSKNKMVAIIVAVIVGLGVLGTAGWLLFGIITGGSITLKEYSGDKFSLLVPETYEQDILSSTATFKEPDAEASDRSEVRVLRVSSSIIGDRDAYIKAIDENFTEDKLSASLSGSRSIENYVMVKSTKDGNDIRTVTADAVEDGKKVGIVRYVVVIGEKSIYAVLVAAHTSDPALAANAEKITDSFKLK